MESLFILTDDAKTKIIEILQEENVFQGKFRIYLSLSNGTYQYAFAIDTLSFASLESVSTL